MKKGDLIQELKQLKGISGNEDVYLKSPGGGQWGELVLRRATREEKETAGIAIGRWVAVITAEGNEKLTLTKLLAKLGRLPEIAEIYLMHYPNEASERLAEPAMFELKSLLEDGQTQNVVSLSVQEAIES